MSQINISSHASIPQQVIGPVAINGSINEEVYVPLATYESPLWPSVNRGAKVARLSGGIDTVITKNCMTRSILLEAKNAAFAAECTTKILTDKNNLADKVQETSRYAQLEDIHVQQIGNLLFIRFALFTGEASGHNMVTKAADNLMEYILTKFQALQHISVSGNFCTDKKASAVNGILGRGKYVIADCVVPRVVCEEVLKTTPEKIVELNVKKNLIGTNIAGGIRSANAHFANMLLAIYLATGQDAANIIEGSQGIVHAELVGHDLYFSVTLPNIIVGTIGNGKDLDFVQENLRLMGCISNSARLAEIVAATVWCGEISLLAAQTNPGELMQSHIAMERGNVTC
jgi:hydroxymethylglutaryl-CoA reductase (NADPH)